MNYPEFLSCDLDDTLENYYGVFPGVMEFLGRQSAKRPLVLATRSDQSVEMMIGHLKPYFAQIYYKQTVSRGREFYEDQFGQLYKPNSPNQSGFENSYPARQYANPFSDEIDLSLKDLHLVKRLYLGCHHQNARVIHLGDDLDLTCAASDPNIPHLVINDQKWATRNRAEAILDTLYSGVPSEVFDQIYSLGQAVPYSPNHNILDQVVVSSIGELQVRMSKSIRADLVRIVEEMPV